jgi:hypothetical protein
MRELFYKSSKSKWNIEYNANHIEQRNEKFCNEIKFDNLNHR